MKGLLFSKNQASTGGVTRDIFIGTSIRANKQLVPGTAVIKTTRIQEHGLVFGSLI